MLRLDRNYEKSEEGRPLLKMSANCELVRTWRTWASSTTTLMDKVKIDFNMLSALVLDRIDWKVEDADVVVFLVCGVGDGYPPGPHAHWNASWAARQVSSWVILQMG
jgi:hypothetical protein